MNPRSTPSRNQTAISTTRGLTRALALGLCVVAGLALGQATKPQPIGGPKPAPTPTKPVSSPTKPVTPPAAPVKPVTPAPTKPVSSPTKPATPAPTKPSSSPTKPVSPAPTPTKPSAQPGGKPVVTPRSNPKVQDGGTLNGPTGFGSDGYSSVALPLVAVGKQVGWRIAPDDFRVFVPRAASGRSIALEVFSPDVNRNDYANGRDRRTYYGDELYGKTAKLTTNFSFKNPTGQTLADRTFGESLKHTYERLYQANLEPGFYPFTALADGNGKNSFALRVTGGARVEASQFTVTARGQFNQDQVVGFVQIDPSQLGKTVKLENYDADGNQEIVLTLVAPDGKRIALTASGDVQWATNAFVINQGLVGTWKVLARILPTTRQFSNSFAFRVRVNDQPLFAQIPGFGIQTPPVLPLQCEVVDPSGASITGASCTVSGGATRTLRPILPECFTPVSASILEGVGVVVSSDRVEVTSPSGRVRFVAECPQAKVQVNAVALVCGQRSPLTNISVNVGGQVVTAPAVVIVNPGQVNVGANVPGATSQVVFVTAERGQTKIVNLEITPRLALAVAIEGKPPAGGLSVTTQLGDAKFENPTSALNVGDTATVVAVVSTGFTQPVPATVNVTLPAGLEATGETRLTGSVVGGKPLTLRIPVRATSAVSDVQVRATLEPNCGVQAVTLVTISQPVTPPTPPPVPDPAKLELTKTVDRDLVKPGDKPIFTIIVKNVGGSTATAVRLTDTLPSGLVGDAIAETFDLPAGESRTVRLPATVTDDATGVIVNTARVDWNGEVLTAPAQVRVQPVIDLKITKAVSAPSVKIGESVTYTMVVTNNGPSLATGVKLSDPLPEGLTYVSSTASQGSASFAAGTISATLGSLARGGSATVTVVATTVRTGRFVNTASVSGTETETTLENNRASAALEVVAPPPPAQGSLAVKAFVVTCNQRLELPSAGFTVNGQRYTTPTSLTLAPGSYTLQPDVLPGSTAQPVTVNVTANGTAIAEILYNVQVSLNLEPGTAQLAAGETRTLTATANTLFPYPVPTTINLTLPEGFSSAGPLTQAGTVSSGKPLTLSVPVRALTSVSSATVRASLEPSCNVTANSVLTVTPAPLPDQRRESQVVLLAKLADVPVQGRALILSDRIPAGSSYISGSSRLLDNPTFDVNTPTAAAGQAIADPYMSGDRLFWVIPLKANTLATRRQALADAAKRGFLTLSRNAQGQTVYGITYRLAHTGALVMPADRVAVIVALPGARSADGNRNDARIDPNSAMGKILGLGDLRVLQGDPSILEALNLAIPFTGEAGAGNERPQGGPATSLKVSVERPTTDSVDRPTLLIEAFDKDGLPANDEFVTVELSVDPVEADAQPGIPGYQVALENGVGRVRLQNLSGGVSGQSTPPVTEVRVEARVINENGTISSSSNFKVTEFSLTASNPLAPNSTNTTAISRPVVAAGTLGIGGNYDFSSGAFSLNGGLRFFLRGDIFENVTLTLGINWLADYDLSSGALALSGDLMPPANPFERFPLLGDSSVLGSDVRSTEGTYFKLESGSSYLLFGQFAPGFRGVLSGYNPTYNGFQGVIRQDGFSLTGFATDTPNADQRFRKQADGSDLYFLSQGGIAENSDRVVIVTYSRLTGQKISGRTLTRNADYTIEYDTGILRLRQALTSTDNDLNPQFLEVDFATGVPGRDFRFGAQAAIGGPGFSLTATALQFRNGQFGGNSSFLFGAGVAIQQGPLNVNLEGALSGPFGSGQGLGLAAQASYAVDGFQFRLDYRDRNPNFVHPESNAIDSGRALLAGLTIGDPNGFRINAALLHNQEYTGGTGSTGASAEARVNLGGNFTVGLGLQYLYSFPVNSNELWLTGGIAVPLGALKVTVDGRLVLAGTPTTYGGLTAGLEYALTENFSLRLQDRITFEPNGPRQQASFGVTGAFSNSELLRGTFGNETLIPDAFGQTNVTAAYELDTLDGNAGRARVGVETTIPLSNNFSAQLGGEAVFNPNSNTTGSASVGLLYEDSSLKGLARAQLSFQPQGLKQVYTFGLIAPLSNEFIISPYVEYAVDPSRWSVPGATSADGGRFSVALAYRGDDWSVLSNNTGKFGVYAANGDYLEGETQFGYQASERFYLRSGLAYRYQFGGGTFTGQIGAGFSYFLTTNFAVGVQAGYLFSSTGSSKFAFGVEGSLRVVDNLLFTVGFNALGFNGIGNSFNPGVYFRFDWKIDERTFGWR